MKQLITPEIVSGVVGFFTLCGAIIYGLKKNGLLHFGKPIERRSCLKQCPDHPLLEQRVINIEKNQDMMTKKLERVADDTSFIRGKINGLHERKVA